MRLPRGTERARAPGAPARGPARARRRSTRLIAASLHFLWIFAAIAALRASGLDLPFYWDEAGAYMPGSFAVARRGLWTALPGCHEKGLLHGHPPVLYLLHGAIHQLFGAEIWPHRLASVAFAAIGVVATYRLGERLDSRATGIAAAVLLLVSPMYFAQSTMVFGDLPITALGAAALYFLFAGRPLAYAVTATLLVQTKETALAIVVAAAIHDALRRPRDAAERKSIAMHAVPIGSLALFYLVEYLRTGAFVQAAFFTDKPFQVFDWTRPLKEIVETARTGARVARLLFVAEGRFALAGIVAAAFWVSRRSFRRAELATLVLVIAFYGGAFALLGVMPRYLMPTLPCLCLLAAIGARALARGRIAVQVGLTGAAAMAALPYFWFASETGTFETNLRHERAIAVSQEAAAYAETELGDAILVADWPFTRYLTLPDLGYVRRPLARVHPARDVRRPLATAAPRKRIALLHSSMAPTPAMQARRAEAEAAGFTVVRRFASEELVVEVLVREPLQAQGIERRNSS